MKSQVRGMSREYPIRLGPMAPLVLRRTAGAIASVLGQGHCSGSFLHSDAASSVELNAGLLWMHGDSQLENEDCPHFVKELLLDSSAESSVVAVDESVLRRLCLTSGSWVVVRNSSTKVKRLARILLLEPLSSSQEADGSSSLQEIFPSCQLRGSTKCAFQPHIAYVSPLLAFNLGMHLLWLESVLQRQNGDDMVDNGLKLCVEVQGDEVKVASHLRIACVRVPVSSNLKPSPLNNQEDIHAALQLYFKRTRILSTGDVFAVRLQSPTTSGVYRDFHFAADDDDTVFFKVVALEPSTGEYLCVDQQQTALFLSGTISSCLPPLVLRRPQPWVFSLHSAAVQQLISLLAPCLHPEICPLRVAVLLLGPAGSGKRTIVKQVAASLGIHVVEYNCYEIAGESEAKTALALENAFKVASRYSPAILLLRRLGGLADSTNRHPEHPEGPARSALTLKSCISRYRGEDPADDHSVEMDFSYKENDGQQLKTSGDQLQHGGPVLLVGAAEDEDSVKLFRSCFTHEISIGTPDEGQRLELLRNLLGFGEIQHDNEEDLVRGLKSISSQTAGLCARDLLTIAADIGAMAVSVANEQRQEIKCAEVGDQTLALKSEYLEKALDRSKKRTASAIGTPQVPNVKWEDIGGLEEVKRAILDTVQVPLIHKELFTSGLRQRSGVLLYGPPGTGKTLLAKAVATECSLNFLSVKGPELINMFIGESEKNVREIFQKARGARPCVVFFDELDALAPARGASGDSGGVMDRVVSQMLAEIDGLGESSQDLFVIGATNRPDLIDSALLRPGRFDKLLYVGISADPSYREKVLSALTRKFALDEDVTLLSLARRCPETFTGADMYALCADAWMQAVKRKASMQEEDGSTVVVKQQDFLKALAELKPSLSSVELEKYERLRQQFQGSKR